MSTTQHHDADRETLSALFDGELDDAATRFAVKRLDHDRQWREPRRRDEAVVVAVGHDHAADEAR